LGESAGSIPAAVSATSVEAAESTTGASPESPEPFPQLRAALAERSSAPGRRLLSKLARDGALAPAVLAVALGAAAGGVVFEALLFRVRIAPDG
jgi:hypothetical protein